MILIYELSDPITGLPKYIGKTNGPISARLKQHLYDSCKRGRNSHKDNWIKGLIRKGLSPIITLIDCVQNDVWSLTEQYWISQYKNWGFDLLNITDGGELSHKPAESYVKMVDTRKQRGAWTSESTKTKIAKSKTGVKLSFEHKIKISQGAKRNKIAQYKGGSLITIFDNSDEVLKSPVFAGMRRASITNACNGNYECKGFNLKYV